jgi:hypothetical protein
MNEPTQTQKDIEAIALDIYKRRIMTSRVYAVKQSKATRRFAVAAFNAAEEFVRERDIRRGEKS